MAMQGPTRTITLTFETEEQARRFDVAMNRATADLPVGIREPIRSASVDETIDLALAIEYLAARAINAQPFSGSGDPDVLPAKVEIAAGAQW